MRKLVFLLATLLVTALAGRPSTAHAATPAAVLTPGASTALVSCILPQCNGPYCREPNGCWTCCN
jgi:hypothetical protein